MASRKFGLNLVIVLAIAALFTGFWALINRPVAESVYLTCRGGALLKYVPGFTAAETQLLSAGASVLPSALVSGLWAAGQLAVLETDAFWNRAGVLGKAWQANLQAEPDPLDVEYGRDKDEL